MGQKKAVMTYRLVTRGTVEERMMQARTHGGNFLGTFGRA
jgi:hypothetical protein